MTMIPPEERARMRREINEDTLVEHYCIKPEHMLELLDTMDTLESRAKEAEAQRDWLADVLISKSYCPDMYNQCANPEDRSCVSATAEQKKACWLEWASAQVRDTEQAARGGV